MSFKFPSLCDRRVYDKKGSWHNPNEDIVSNIFYFVKEPLTLTSEWNGGGEELIETTTITIFGGKPIAIEDDITLEDGHTYKVRKISINYLESNVMLKDMLKPRIESMDLVLA